MLLIRWQGAEVRFVLVGNPPARRCLDGNVTVIDWPGGAGDAAFIHALDMHEGHYVALVVGSFNNPLYGITWQDCLVGASSSHTGNGIVGDTLMRGIGFVCPCGRHGIFWIMGAVEILTTAKNGSIKLNCYKSLKLLFQIAVLFYLRYIYLI